MGYIEPFKRFKRETGKVSWRSPAMGGRDHHRWETVGPPGIQRKFLYEVRVKLSMSLFRLRRESELRNTPLKRTQLEKGARSRDLC